MKNSEIIAINNFKEFCAGCRKELSQSDLNYSDELELYHWTELDIEEIEVENIRLKRSIKILQEKIKNKT